MAQMKRDLAKQRAWQRRSKPLARRSAAKIAQDRKRAPIVAKLRQGPCEARIEGICTGRAQTGHEPLLRSGGSDPSDEAQMLAVCNRCHEHIHQHPAESYASGLLKHRWDVDARAQSSADDHNGCDEAEVE